MNGSDPECIDYQKSASAPLIAFQLHTTHQYEDDEFDGPLMAYWAHGHIDPRQFAIACNREFECCKYCDHIVRVCDVEHEWQRNVPDRLGEGMLFYRARPGSQGAYKITKFDLEKVRSYERD